MGPVGPVLDGDDGGDGARDVIDELTMKLKLLTLVVALALDDI